MDEQLQELLNLEITDRHGQPIEVDDLDHVDLAEVMQAVFGGFRR